MILAFFSDIHANLPALEAVLDDMDRRSIDMLFCLGDLVGYGTWPNEVCDEIRRRRIPTIAGNYDQGVGLASDDCGCAYKTDEEKEMGSRSIAYTNSVVTPATRDYLKSLPRHINVDLGNDDDVTSLLMVHGSPRKINEYLFEDRTDKSLERMMDTAGADIMLFGHTHRPYHKVLSWQSEGGNRQRQAINTGSVGKPKDGDPRACYVLLHVEGRKIEVEFARVEYDVERAARAIEQTEALPSEFATMLRNGG